jgi:hypothetical protein
VLEARGAETGLARGYTRVPNSLLMRLVGGELSKHEAQVLLFVVRMTVSFRRELAPMSKSIVERFTGIRGSAALQALSRLESLGLIRRVPGDERRPSLVGLRLDPEWDWLRDNPGQKPTQGSKTTPGDFAPGDQIAPASPGRNAPTRNNILLNEKETLSPTNEKLREYFAAIKAPRKRESEWEAYRELREGYPDADIADCVALVERRGVLGAKGEDGERIPCHSPMAYLAKAMGQALSEVERERQAARERAERERQQREAEARFAEEQEREARDKIAREAAFERAFPTEAAQMDAIERFCAGMPFNIHSPVGKIIAIGRWWTELGAQDREALMG